MMKKALCLILAVMFLLTACQQPVEPEVPPVEEAPPAEEAPVETQPEEPKKNVIPEGVFTSFDGDFWQTDRWDIFEEHFYGVWYPRGAEYSEIHEQDLVLTYQMAQNCGEYPQAFAETETDWYMSVFNGGSGDLYRKSKDSKNSIVVYYEYPGRDVDYYKSDRIYYRKDITKWGYEEYPAEITTGPMSIFAIRKLNQELDCVLNYDGSITTNDGTRWQTDYRDTWYYLEELPTETRISYIRRAYPNNAELGPWDDEARRNLPWAHINIVVEQVEGEWKQTSANIATLEQELDTIGYMEDFSREMWSEYEIGWWSEVDYDSPATVEGWEWSLYHLKGPNVDTKEHFRKYLNTVFSEECTETILDRWIGEGKHMFEDAEGRLCTPEGARGGNMYAGELEREITANDGKTATIHYTCYTADYALEDVGREILEEYDIKAVYTDLGWRLADLYWPY